MASDVHLASQSFADGIVRLESKLVSKLTDVERFDIEKQRHAKTLESQEAIKTSFKVATGFVGAFFKASTKPLVSGENINFEEAQSIHVPN